MSIAKRSFLVLSALLFGSIIIAAQTAKTEFERGKTIDQVTTVADKSQSYALYLPRAYDPGLLFPAIYCFDPSGRGRSAVEKYRAAAEKLTRR